MPELLDETHPGEILLEDFMKPMGISARQLAADIDVPPVASANWCTARVRLPLIRRCARVFFSKWNRVSG